MDPVLAKLDLSAQFLDLYDVDAAFNCALNGGTLKAIASAMGMVFRTFCRLRFTNASFKAAIDRARIEGREVIHDNIRVIVDENLHLSPQLVKIKSENDIWFLKTSDPGKYGDRVLVQNEDVNLKDALQAARTRVIEHQPPNPEFDPFSGS